MNSKLKKQSATCKNKRTLISGTDTHISKFFAQKQASSNADSTFDEEKPSENEATVEDIKLDVNSEPSNLHPDSTVDPDLQESKMNDDTSRVSTRSKRSKETISKFFNQSVSDNDFETPVKQPKRTAPKRKVCAPRGQSKRQMKIKTAFARTEEAFTKLIADHSAAENLNPDEFQMALALSRSEIETNASFCEDSTGPLEDLAPDNFEAVKCMIRKFAFNSTEETNMPPRKRTKWANKFTPLTMRDSEKQLKKMNAKIEEIVSSQFTDKINIQNEATKLNLISNLLSNLKSEAPVVQPTYSGYTVEDFYIKDLFKPSKVKVGHLLKDYKSIPGRDVSPIKSSKSANRTLSEEILDKEENLQFDNSSQLSDGSEILSDNKENGEDKPNIKEILENSIERKGDDINVRSNNSNNNNKNHTSTPNLANPAIFVVREPSPDLFADCDISDPLQKSSNNITPIKDNNNKSILSDEEPSNAEDCSIVTFEKYSSEEVKIYDNNQTDRSTTIDHHSNCNIKNTSIYQQKQIETDTDTSKDKNSLDFIDLTENDSLDSEIVSENALQLTASSSIGDNNKIEEKLSQSKSIDECDLDSSGDCVLISDDEVNYSMKVISSKKFDNNESDKQKSIDLTMSSSAESCTSEKLNNDCFKLPEKVLQSIGKEEDEIADDSFIISTQQNVGNSSKSNDFALQSVKVRQNSSAEEEIGDDSFVLSAQEDIRNFSRAKSLAVEFEKVKRNKCTEEEIADDSFILSAQQNIGNSSKLNDLSLESEEVLQNSLVKEKICDDSFILSAQENNRNFSRAMSLACEFEKTNQNKYIEEEIGDDSYILSAQQKIDNCFTEEEMSDSSFILPAQKNIENSSKNKNLSMEFKMDSSKQCLTPKRNLEYSFAAESVNKVSLDINMSSGNNSLREENEKEIVHTNNEYNYVNLDQSVTGSTDGSSSSNKIFNDHTNIQMQLSNSYKSNLGNELKDVEGISFLESNENHEKQNDETFFNLSKLRAQYGIVEEECKLQPKPQKSLSEQILKSVEKNNLKRYHSSINNNNCNMIMETDEYFSDVDEIDKLVQLSPIKNRKIPTKPEGIDKLLTSDLSFITEDNTKEFVFDNKVYLVKTKNISEKPDYEQMDSPMLLKELYKNGLKPLKKKQAVTMLDYIYNQTHPTIVSEDEDDVNISQAEKPLDSTVNAVSNQHNFFNLKDCYAEKLLRPTERQPEIPDEDYIFPTNKSSKISTVPLPLHIAWFNLVRSNDHLHEAVLHYEPIDLQEIFLFLKKIGYRYDPKAMKKFFDSRSIIFRYDVGNGKQNRNERKVRRKVSQKKLKGC